MNEAIAIAARLARNDYLAELRALAEGRDRVSARKVAALLDRAGDRLRDDAYRLRQEIDRLRADT